MSNRKRKVHREEAPVSLEQLLLSIEVCGGENLTNTSSAHCTMPVTFKLLLGIFVNCEMPGEADRVRNLMFSGESESENAGRLWEWDCTTVEEAEPRGVT